MLVLANVRNVNGDLVLEQKRLDLCMSCRLIMHMLRLADKIMHRLLFEQSSKRSKEPLKLIHSDLLTCPTVSYSELHYILVLFIKPSSNGCNS